MKKTIICLLLTVCMYSFSQIQHLEPAFWWTGMKNPKLQLLVHGKDISKADVSLSYAGVKIEKINKVSNPNYLFVDLLIDNKIAKAGKFDIKFKVGNKEVSSYKYELKARENGSSERKGFSSSDVMYLLMPDRFANGSTANDSVKGLKEKTDRTINYGRHGGDIKGMQDHLDYLKELGITAVWTTPVLENDEPKYTYHGYAISDYYKMDGRFGTNEEYVNFIKASHAKGIKVVMDLISNHCGIDHWWMKDLPTKDWVHYADTIKRCNFRMSTINDPHASQIDKELNSNGWFDTSMPDLNQKNEYLITYLTQNAIWWVEYSGLDGIRMDTYPYNDPQGMAKWAKGVMDEYPNFNIVGETWTHTSHEIAFWQRNNINPTGYNSYLPTVMDFVLHDNIGCFNEKESWDGGLRKLYLSLSHDYLYADLNNILVFGENHDTQRLNKVFGENIDKYKMAMAFLLTTRGIPQLYYGSELGMTGDKGLGDGDIRRDMPGGWIGDTQNAFDSRQRTEQQKAYFNYLSKILNWRQGKEVIHTGKLIQYVPEEDIYVYFRYNDKETVMVVLNNNDTEKEFSTSRYSECLKNKTKAKDIITDANFNDISRIKIAPKSALILELK